jgi:serine/threonine protein kinase/cytochrome c-type biogenesis protein CcmH/NrfG
MTPAQLQTIEEIFYAALEQDSDDVARFLETTCEGDELLRGEVEALLAWRQRVGSFIETPAVGIATRIIGNGQADLLVGQTIGHYKISKRIGSGGMGEVYLATDVTAGRKAALKLLPMLFTGDAERLKRFQQEAHAVVGLNHPNILTVYEIGQDHSTYYIASELIEGETLRQRLMRGRMELSEAVDLAIQVASALTAAHEAGIVHRDINPGNIMLRPDGYVKVLDFGIAKLAEQEAPATMPKDEALLLVETNLGSILGTVPYMSPEQACGTPIDKRTDIWSLGVVLYEMVTGHQPFIGDTPRKAMTSILEKEPPPLASYIRQTPAELQQIISRTLHKDRTERYQNASEMLQALKSLRHNLELKAELERSTVPLWLRWARSPIALMLVLLLSALALALPFYRHRNPATSLPPEKSIAVLPLENLSDEKENAFFAVGIQDELLSNLAKIKDLKVISRTSVMQYKSGITRNLKEIAQQLGVSNVVEGSVRRSGNHIRVSVQLIDAKTDRHIWVQNYDRTLADSLALQGDLAREIAAAVGATLSPQEKARVEARPTNNAAAYDAYLRGRAFKTGVAWSDNADVAIRSYQQAVKLDPNFALAWAYLSCAQLGSYWVGIDHNPARLTPAKDSLDHALALDSNLPETHLALGYYRYYGQLDFTGALAEFQQAERDLPNNIDILQAITLIQRRLGHWDEAIEAARRAVELDPRNVVSSIVLAETYRCVRRFLEALATADRLLAFDPTNGDAIWMKASVFLATGDLNAVEPLLANSGTYPLMRGFVAMFQRRYAAAIEILSKESATESDRSLRTMEELFVGLSQQRAGDVAAARATYQKVVQELQREFEKEAPDRADLGLAYAGLGEAASAIAEGQKALAMQPTSKDPYEGPAREEQMARIYSLLGDGDHAIPILKRLLQIPYYLPITPGWLRLDPVWDQIRNDPRFQKLWEEKKP